MRIKEIEQCDVEAFYRMLCALDRETPHMLYEPGEREETTPDLRRLSAGVEAAVAGLDCLLVAESDAAEIVGFLWAQRGGLRRVAHSAYVVMGIREAWRRQGIGSELLKRLERWAKEKGVLRLELTVECVNHTAKRLYEKCGFQVEGRRAKSMKVDGEFLDEFYMGKIVE